MLIDVNKITLDNILLLLDIKEKSIEDYLQPQQTEGDNACQK